MKQIRRKLHTNTQMVIREMSNKMPHGEPKMIAHTRAKSGDAAAEKQREDMLLNQAHSRSARMKKAKRSNRKY